MPLSVDQRQQLSKIGEGMKLAGVNWTEAEDERFATVWEYASLNRDFRKKVLANPRELFESIGVLFPKNITLEVKEPGLTETQPTITLTLPAYVGTI